MPRHPFDELRSGTDMRWLKQLYALLLPPQVKGDSQYGFVAKYPWERAWCWSSKRNNAIQGCRDRALVAGRTA